MSALRRAHPRAHLTLIALPDCEWLLRRFSGLFDRLLPFPGFPGLPERAYSPDELAALLWAARSKPFDLAVQMHGSGPQSNRFTSLLGARSSTGFYHPAREAPPGERFLPYPEHGSEVHRWLRLTDALCCPRSDDRLVFPVSDADRAKLKAHEGLGSLEPGRYVCVHPGARDAARRWPSERFAAVADALAERGLTAVLTGTAAERPAAEAVHARMRRPAVNAAGETDIGTAAALLERAALLVTNDTGVSHLAAALATPSVIVFLASEPQRWAPLERALHRPVVARGLAASAADGMRLSGRAQPEPAEVLEEAVDLLRSGDGS